LLEFDAYVPHHAGFRLACTALGTSLVH
jgi:hypothetical protein